jgi:uncharacterized protein DUF3160
MRFPALILTTCSLAACAGSPPRGTENPAGSPAPPVALTATASAARAPVPDPVCRRAAERAEAEAAAADGDTSSEYSATVRRPRNPGDVCAVADSNLQRAERAILAAASAGPGGGAGAGAATAHASRWDHRTRPAGLDLVARRFQLSPPELLRLSRDGLMVLDRVSFPNYSWAFHETFQSQLPVYVSIDAILHAVFASHDGVVKELEGGRLYPLLVTVAQRLHCALPAAAADYPAEVARDLDVYLTVARRLLEGSEVPGALGDPAVDRQVAALVARALAAEGLETVTLFGRPRVIDFSQLAPRGHYQGAAHEQYFRGAMWLSRLELNLMSRSSRSSAPGEVPDPSETPREATVALALADLAERSGQAAAIAELDRAWGALAGRREDVSLADLVDLRRRAGIASLRDPRAADQLRAAIGDRFRRTVRVHYMPEGSTDLPVIATLLGPRIVADARALMPIVHGAVPGRLRIGLADVAYLLGDDHARGYLAGELARFPDLAAGLERGRRAVKDAAPGGDDLYGAWLAAVRALAVVPEGVVPSWLDGRPYQDLRLNSMAAAYGQLKHNYVLMAGEPYAEFGCEIPDGWVEPAAAVYDALIEYAARGARVAAAIDPRDESRARRHFVRLGEVLRTLRAIVADELADRPLSSEERRFLGMVAELDIDRALDITGHPPTYTGWYFDLFYEREGDGMRGADFVADYFTSAETIAYLGAGAPRLGVFVVDTGGAPRVFAGPVASAYEHHAAPGPRLTDAAARELSPAAREAPWAASYTVPATAEAPSVEIGYDPKTGDVEVRASEDLGRVRVELLDHHRAALADRTQRVGPGTTRFRFHRRHGVGAVAVRAGGYLGWVVKDAGDEIHARWGRLAQDGHDARDE